MSFVETIEQKDQELMLYLNGLNAEWLDPVMILISNPVFWIPLHLFGFGLAWRFFGYKVALLSFLSLGLCILLNDRISVELFKEVFERYRPCHNLILGPKLNIPNGCGGMYGFVSSHSANYFGMATLFGFMFRKRSKWFLMGLLCWAGLIAYSRIYLGVHYPGDVVCGSLLGICLGYLAFSIQEFAFNKMKLNSD